MYNIYHLLNSSYGYVIKRELMTAFRVYKRGDNHFWIFEEESRTSLETLFYCDLISWQEYTELDEQLCYLMRLYKGARGSALGRKDVM